MALVRYKTYNGGTRYKLKSPSFNGKGSFVLGVALMVTEDTSEHIDVTCFDGADGSITVVASGGTSPYVYSLDPNFSTTNSTGVFTGLSVSGTVYESTDQYGGIVVCHKTIYAKDANGRIGHVDVLLQSPVEFAWLYDENWYTFVSEVDEVLTISPIYSLYADEGGTVYTPGVDFPVPYLSTTAGDTRTLPPSGYPTEYNFIPGRTYNILMRARTTCPNGYIQKICKFSITVLSELSLTETTSAHHDVTCFDGGDGSVTVVASGGTPPYQYSTDPNFATYNTNGVFSNLSLVGPVDEGTDQYGSYNHQLPTE